MGRIEIEIKSSNTSKSAVSDNGAPLIVPNDALTHWEQKADLNARKIGLPTTVQTKSVSRTISQHELVNPQEFGRAMDEFTKSTRMMAYHVEASIAPLCSISAMGDRIDRLNRENAETLDKLINGRL